MYKGVFYQTHLQQTQFGLDGPKAQTQQTFFLFFWAGSSPAVRVGLDPSDLAWLLVQTSNRPWQRARVNQVTRALHSAKVIIITFALFCKLQKWIKRVGGRKLTWAKTKTKTRVIILAPVEECPFLPPPSFQSLLPLSLGFFLWFFLSFI